MSSYEAQFESFLARRKKNALLPRIDNSKLPAGSPMHYPCTGCNADIEIDELDFGPDRPKECPDCKPLKAEGVLDEFIERAEAAAR